MGWFDDKEADDKVKKKSEDFQKKYASDVDAPKEQGLEEEGYTDVLKPAKQMGLSKLRSMGAPELALTAADAIVPDSPLYLIDKAERGIKEAKGAGKLLRMMRPPAKSSSKLGEVSKVMREEALMNPSKLDKINEDVNKAKNAYKAEKKASLYGAQAQKDVAERIKPAGLGKDAAPYQGNLVNDVKKQEADRIAKLRDSGISEESLYAKKAPTEAGGNVYKGAEQLNKRGQKNIHEVHKALTQERMGLDMSKPEDRIRLQNIDKEIKALYSPAMREY